MLRHFPILRVIIPFIIPYIILYAIYIQLNGEISPGGGFQAGVIFASSIIAFDLILGKSEMQKYFSNQGLTICGVLGVMLYAGVGVIPLIFDDNYLNYDSLAHNNISGQHIGIFSIELGVGLTVASIMCLIYSSLRDD